MVTLVDCFLARLVTALLKYDRVSALHFLSRGAHHHRDSTRGLFYLLYAAVPAPTNAFPQATPALSGLLSSDLIYFG